MQRVLAALLCLFPTSVLVAAPAPEAVVRAFNAALSERKLDAAVETLAPGAVNFNMGSVHGFPAKQGAADPLTSDLAIHWRTVAPVLYGASKRYERRVEHATTQSEGALAVVWAHVRSTTDRKDGTTTTLAFAETYLLRLDQGAWRIIGIASARPTR
jgi:ketosteroid isomerase-like protein